MKKVRSLLCAAGIILFAVRAFAAQTLTFPVKGLVTAAPDPVPLSVDWNESWFGDAPATVYNHGIARVACVLSTVAYDAVDSTGFTDSLSRCYEALSVPKNTIEYHYDVDYSMPFWGNDQCAFSFAHRSIESAKGRRNLVFLVVRGTPLNANEWVSNLDIGKESAEEHVVTLHNGFTRAAQQILTAFYAYLLEQHIDLHASYVLVTGHSRGAAVANLLGVQLIQNRLFSKDNLYVYTFATPNVTTDKDAADEKYGFIWNLVNGEDLVPTVPLSRNQWQFRKYGNTRVFVNAWSALPEQFEADFFPRINRLYRQFLLRDYAPFKTGAFIPAQLTRMLAILNSNVAKYYSSGLGVHQFAEKILWKAFPEKAAADKDEERAAQKKSLFANWVNSATNGLVDYVAQAAVDMHASELYLSYLLALDEDELYSDKESAELVISGSFEGAVFDSKGTVLLQILDNHVVYKSLCLPAAAFQITPATLVIGLPPHSDYTVVLYHSSLLPTPVSVRIEQYDANGIFKRTEEKKRLYLHKGMAWQFAAGGITTRQTQIEPSRIRGKAAKNCITQADLSSLWSFRLQCEANLSTSLTASGGVHIGPPVLYGTMLATHRFDGIDDTLQLTCGIGTGQILWGVLQLDGELWCHFVQDFDTDFSDDDTSGFSFVPALRLSLSVKPRHRLQFFGAVCYDFHIDGFNDRAFDNALRRNLPHAATFGDVCLVPSLQFGVKF